MPTKLTLRLDARLIRSAKRYAQRSGKSVSAVVADYFAALDAADDDAQALSPKVRSLFGALRESGMDQSAYRQYRESKYR